MNAHVRRLKHSDCFAKRTGNSAGHDKNVVMRLRIFALFKRGNRDHGRDGVLSVGNQQNRADVSMQLAHRLRMDLIKETRQKTEKAHDFLKAR